MGKVDDILAMDSSNVKVGITISGSKLVANLQVLERALRVFGMLHKADSVVVYRCSPKQKA
jgi:hypothetical protein